jgi:hypothetical protein
MGEQAMQDGLIGRLCRTRRRREVAALKATQRELNGERGPAVDEALAHALSSPRSPIADLLERPSKYGVRVALEQEVARLRGQGRGATSDGSV